MSLRARIRGLMAALLAGALALGPAAPALAMPPTEALPRALSRVVKIFGAGGVRGLEAYQSGVLISPQGHVLTALSHVLDAADISVVLDDGRRLTAELVAADPRLEIALLKAEAEDLPYFDSQAAASAAPGAQVWALSNAFGVATGSESVGVQHGVIAAVADLRARRGAFASAYDGPVYILDAVTNNPGAAGGALIDRQGRLLGLLGKELRSADTGAWLSYALPLPEIAGVVEAMQAGKLPARGASRRGGESRPPEHRQNPELLGLVLVPDVVERTPPFVDAVRADSAAALAGIAAGDLVVLVNDELVQSCRGLVAALAEIEADDPVALTVRRAGQLLPFTLHAVRPATGVAP